MNKSKPVVLPDKPRPNCAQVVDVLESFSTIRFALFDSKTLDRCTETAKAEAQEASPAIVNGLLSIFERGVRFDLPLMAEAHISQPKDS